MKDLSLDKIVGFNASNWRTVIHIGGVRYRIQPEGVVAIKLAVKVLRMTEANRPLYGLRGEIRAVRKSLCRAALTQLISVTTNEKLRLVAIWLRGQCGGYLGKEVLAKLSASESEAERLKVARALQRMSGWSVLKRMSANDPSPRVRRIASSREPQAFQSRLSQFVDKSQSLPVASPDTLLQREIYIANDFELKPPKDPKSVEFIRAVLERIRLLVRERIEVG